MLANGVVDYESGHLVQDCVYFARACLETIVTILIILVLRDMLRDIASGESPFALYQARRLRFIAILQIAHAIVTAIGSPAFLKVIGLGDATLGATIGSASIDGAAHFIPINAGDIVLAIVLFCAALIVEYGSLLQKLSDDTL